MTVRIAAPLVLLLLAAAPAPDPVLTPGAVRPDFTTARQTCAVHWSLDERAVTTAMKRAVYQSYGYPAGSHDPRCPCVVDHLVPREAAGADKVVNLWVQTRQDARTKDRLENKVHHEMCAGRLTLRQAQAVFLHDWRDGYRHYFGEDP